MQDNEKQPVADAIDQPEQAATAGDAPEAAAESLLGYIYDLCVGTAGETDGTRFFPLVATIFVFVLFQNVSASGMFVQEGINVVCFVFVLHQMSLFSSWIGWLIFGMI